MDDLTHNCSSCHEQLRTPSQHTCGRNPQGGLPASQPHKDYAPGGYVSGPPDGLFRSVLLALGLARPTTQDHQEPA